MLVYFHSPIAYGFSDWASVLTIIIIIIILIPSSPRPGSSSSRSVIHSQSFIISLMSQRLSTRYAACSWSWNHHHCHHHHHHCHHHSHYNHDLSSHTSCSCHWCQTDCQSGMRWYAVEIIIIIIIIITCIKIWHCHLNNHHLSPAVNPHPAPYTYIHQQACP